MSDQLINFRPVIEGAVYRSAAPYDWQLPQVRSLAEGHGVQTVVDLRQPVEIERADWPAGSDQWLNLAPVPIDLAVQAGIWLRPEEPEGLAEQYLIALKVWAPQWVQALTPIARGEVTLFHCAAGKDRTGIASALVQQLAGHDDEQIIDEYAATAPAMPAIFAALDRANGVEATAEQLQRQNHPVVNAPAGAMRTFLTGLADRYGNAEGYLRWAGASDELVASISQRVRH